jgi:hypothetical protein
MTKDHSWKDGRERRKVKVEFIRENFAQVVGEKAIDGVLDLEVMTM